MARKKQEVALMREIESQEEWEDIMTKEGLWVVDVYQEWCGPCDAMVSNFRRIKNELGDDLLHFAMAKADTVEALEKYRGSCEPCFLFFAAGMLVSFVHGANAPLILRTLTEQLAQEHKVIEGTAERKEVKDPFVLAREAEAMRDEEEEEEEHGRKFQYRGELIIYDDELAPAEQYEEVEEGYTVAIIKPNVVAEGKTDEILAEMEAKGIKVLAQEQRQLTEEEAREFYSHLKDEDYFEDLVRFMSSGPSHVLVLTRGQADDSIIKDWRDMLGPPAVEDAKEQAPDSLRARYGDAGLMNALHGSDSKETAARELAFFFPHMEAPKLSLKKKDLQRTLALIRPDAFATKKDEILEKIKEAGFQIALHKVVTLTREQAEDFYKEHEGQPYFEELVTRMSSGPMLALGLAREDAIEGWRDMLGPPDVEEAKTSAPDSLRAQFSIEENPLNQLHGSDSPQTAKQELQYFFPMQQTVAMIKPDAYGTKDAIVEKIHEAGFRIAAHKEDTITREIAEAFYADQRGKDYYNDLVEHMTSGPTMFMVLSREDAVEGWREMIGPTDPEKAKEEAPESLRAQFGQDVLHNAVHGSSNPEQAKEKMEKIFGHLEFKEDGKLQGPEEEQEAEQEPEQQAVIESGGTEAADVAPEYRQQEVDGDEEQKAEQEQEYEHEQEQEYEQEYEHEQEQEPEKTEGAGEGEAKSEEKPAEEKEEGAENTEKEQKPSKEKEGEAEKQPETESSHSGLDAVKGETAAKEEAAKEEKPAEAAEQQPQETAGEQKAEGEAEKPEPAAEEQKAEEPKEEEKKEDAPAEEPKTEDAKPEEKAEGTADSKPEGQTDDSQQQKDTSDTTAKN